MRVITFGELMLRLAPNGYLRFVQSDNLEATFGGAEANVAVSLANYGVDVAFVSKLPTHEIGQSAVNSLRKFGVDTSLIVRGGERVGIYYCEKVLRKDRVRLFTIERIRLSQWLKKKTLTGLKSLKELTGSTLRELHRHFPTKWLKFA